MKKLILLVIISLSQFIIIQSQTVYWEELNLDKYPPSRVLFGLSGIGDNKAIMFGGLGSTDLNDTWIFNLNEKKWTEIELSVKPIARDRHRLALLTKNKVLLFGGRDKYGNVLDDTWIFDCNEMKWTEIIPKEKPPGRDSHGMAQVTDNIVIIFGGNTNDKIHNSDSWIYNYLENTWVMAPQKLSHIPRQREGAMMTQISYGKVLLYGGWSYEVNADTWIFDYNGNQYEQWNQMSPQNDIVPISNSSLTRLDDNNILLFGGGYEANDKYDGTWIYKVDKNEWTKLDLDVKPHGRWMHEMTQISENKILLYGEIKDTWIFNYLSTDIKENPTNNSTITISPNPAGDYITLTVGANGSSPVQIYNVLGECVSTSDPSQLSEGDRELRVGQRSPSVNRINVSALPKGIYFVRCGGEVGKFLKI